MQDEPVLLVTVLFFFFEHVRLQLLDCNSNNIFSEVAPELFGEEKES